MGTIRHQPLSVQPGLGRHDESLSYEAESAPLFALLPSPKSLRLFDGGHVPPLAAWIPVATAWLDKYLGSGLVAPHGGASEQVEVLRAGGVLPGA